MLPLSFKKFSAEKLVLLSCKMDENYHTELKSTEKGMKVCQEALFES